MNVKNFIIGGIVGGIVDFLLGWLIYGILLKDTFPKPADAGPENMMFIALGCLCFGFMISYILCQAGVSEWMQGAKVAAVVALFMTLANNFFYSMYKDTMDVKLVAIDIVAALFVAAVVGAAIGMTIGKTK